MDRSKESEGQTINYKEQVLGSHSQKDQLEEEKVHTHVRMLSPASKYVHLQILGLCDGYLLTLGRWFAFLLFFLEYMFKKKKHKINMENYFSHQH